MDVFFICEGGLEEGYSKAQACVCSNGLLMLISDGLLNITSPALDGDDWVCGTQEPRK